MDAASIKDDCVYTFADPSCSERASVSNRVTASDDVPVARTPAYQGVEHGVFSGRPQARPRLSTTETHDGLRRLDVVDRAIRRAMKRRLDEERLAPSRLPRFEMDLDPAAPRSRHQ